MRQRAKDAIKKYNYLEMKKAFEKSNLSFNDIKNIERKIDRLALEYYDDELDKSEIPFNKIIRSFYDDAKVYYAIKYCDEMEYYVRSFVDIGCDSSIYIYQNSLRKKIPNVFSEKRQDRLLKKVIEFRKKVISDIIKYDSSIKVNDIEDFSKDEFLNIIARIDDYDFNKDYSYYLEYRDELVSHNIRAIMNVTRNNIRFFNEKDEIEDFYLYYTLVGTEKYLKKYYSHDSTLEPMKYSSFLFSYGKFMILEFDRYNNSLISKNNSLYDRFRKIIKLYNSGMEFDEISKKLGIDKDEINYLFNYFMPVLSLDSEYECDLKYDENYFETLYLEDMRDKLLSIFDELSQRDKMIIMLRYGFVDGRCWSLKEIGDYLGLTKQAICKIEKSILNHIKPFCQEMKLEDYVK